MWQRKVCVQWSRVKNLVSEYATLVSSDSWGLAITCLHVVIIIKGEIDMLDCCRSINCLLYLIFWWWNKIMLMMKAMMFFMLNMNFHNIYDDVLKIEANSSFGLEATCWLNNFGLEDYFSWLTFDSNEHWTWMYSSGLGLNQANLKVGKYLRQMLQSKTFGELSYEHSLVGLLIRVVIECLEQTL